MTFLDTCIWIELLSASNPTKEHEINQAKAATVLLDNILESKEKIITCKEQLLEVVSAIQKVQIRTVSKTRKQNQLSGIGNLKEFRQLPEFQETKDLCKSAIEDIRHFATMEEINCDIDFILDRLEIADINDCLYYDYCKQNNIKFYTFDADLKKLGNNRILYYFNFQLEDWILI